MRFVRWVGSLRPSHRFHAPVTVLTPKTTAVAATSPPWSPFFDSSPGWSYRVLADVIVRHEQRQGGDARVLVDLRAHLVGVAVLDGDWPAGRLLLRDVERQQPRRGDRRGLHGAELDGPRTSRRGVARTERRRPEPHVIGGRGRRPRGQACHHHGRRESEMSAHQEPPGGHQEGRADCTAGGEARVNPSPAGSAAQSTIRYLIRVQIALGPSRQVIFLPSSYSRP